MKPNGFHGDEKGEFHVYDLQNYLKLDDEELSFDTFSRMKYCWNGALIEI